MTNRLQKLACRSCDNVSMNIRLLSLLPIGGINWYTLELSSFCMSLDGLDYLGVTTFEYYLMLSRALVVSLEHSSLVV